LITIIIMIIITTYTWAATFSSRYAMSELTENHGNDDDSNNSCYDNTQYKTTSISRSIDNRE
jgi:hypothetical protein